MKTKNDKIAIVSCINNFHLFEGLRKSLRIEKNVQLHSIDNTLNNFSVPAAYNLALKNTNAEIFVFVHQDVLFPEKWIDMLNSQIQELERIDKNWGVLGIMGKKKWGTYAGHIIDPHTNRRFGNLPSLVQSVDEVCLIIRRNSGLNFDETLGGYHFYGADICLQARQRRMNNYAIDAPLTHLSGGDRDTNFHIMAGKMKDKWNNIPHSPLTIETTCGVFPLKYNWRAKMMTKILSIQRKLINRINNCLTVWIHYD